MALKNQITEAMKLAMKAKDSQRLGIIRLILSECKRVEVDERIELSDERVIAILDKMTKQRRDSAKQYADAGRKDLEDQENYEIQVIAEYLPTALSNEELTSIIDQCIAESGASTPQDMGKVMALLKPKIQGRADMGVASQAVKAKLG
jgi:uncharacterized protein YqeY